MDDPDLLLVQQAEGASSDAAGRLRGLGLRPLAVPGLAEASASLARVAVDLVVLDLPLSDLEGDPTLREIAAEHTVVVLVESAPPSWLGELGVAVLEREEEGRHWERLTDILAEVRPTAEEPGPADPGLSELQAGLFVRFMAGLAHDINNVLSGVMGYASLLTHRLGERHPDSRFAKAIADSAAQAATVTDQALQSIRMLGRDTRPASIEDLFRGAERLLSAALPKSLSLDPRFGDGLPAAAPPPGETLALLAGVCLHVGDGFSAGASPSTLTIRVRALPPESDSPTRLEVEFLHDVFPEAAEKTVTGRGGIQVAPVRFSLLQEMARRLGGDLRIVPAAEGKRRLRLNLPAASA